MSSHPGEHPENWVYPLSNACDSDEEMRRLDAMHAAVTRYFDGELSPAPIAEMRPRRILDLGCGSGAWAIQAAMQFSDAQVFAVDISPIPDRPIPGNMCFELADLTKDLEFDKEMFDIVHSRLVMSHISNGENTVKRAAQLVRPGGLLLMEDLDIGSLVRTGGCGVHQMVSKMLKVISSNAADGELGRKFEGIVTATGYFPQVHVHKIAIPLSGNGLHETENELGVAFRKSWMQVSEDFGRRCVAHGFTETMIKEQQVELDDRECRAELDFYFCWARRSIE
ncbi:S-adenosyl-L-methionine-dependent methyltransferase [Mycena leptocephala]|nr:S-adenosyl-L-methionine-dependent methyltransferase [Mycena leptocephala]